MHVQIVRVQCVHKKDLCVLCVTIVGYSSNVLQSSLKYYIIYISFLSNNVL